MNPIYVLALMSLALLGGAAADGTKEQLEKLCQLEKHAPQVTRISEVKALVDLLANDKTVECKPKVAQAISELGPLIALENVCSQEAADTIVDFWEKHRKLSSTGGKNLPEPLRQFALGFGKQVSKLCKRTMMDELEKATQDMGIKAEDIKIVSEPIMPNIEKIFPDIRVENLLAIIQAKKSDELKEKRMINVDPKQKRYFELVRERCINKFQPIYNTLIAPVVRLASIGMGYESKSLAEEMSAFEQNPMYKNWFAAVLACEALSRHTPVHIAKEKTNADGDKQMITFLDDEDLEWLRTKTGLTLEEPAIEEPVDYRIGQVQVGDLVLDEADEYLINSISKYKLSVSSVNKFRLRMIKKMPSLMKIYTENKAVEFGLLPSAAKKRQMNRTKFGSVVRKFWTLVVLLIGGAAIGGAIAFTVFSIIATHGTIIGSILIALSGLMAIAVLGFTTLLVTAAIN